ncbi:hypothetical protein FOA52_009470 [Chlamydomonas sp. UWO 241]|nr:hypothetical protein FOA52_009470 [Chlamydomonas sp. UWO 241]
MEVVLNAFIKGTLVKGEVVSYKDGIDALAGLKSQGEDKARDAHMDRCLARLLQYGHLPMSSVQPVLDALRTADKSKDNRGAGVRFVYYLVQLSMGDSSAGTPLPLPVSRGNSVLPKAVDRFGPDVLSAAWADLGDDTTPFMHKQGALRSLAALAHASLTSKPDDPTYVGGLLVTIQSLLDSLESIQAKRSTLAGILAQHGTAAKKTNSLQDFRARMEVCALQRASFSAARVALSKSGINKIAVRAFAGVCSADAAGARHALALACLAARDGSARTYVSEVGTPLRHNVDLAMRTGTLFLSVRAALKPSLGQSAGSMVGAPPPTVSREQLPEGHLNLRDTWARVYLARGCAAVIQSGAVAGDIGAGARGEVFWDALQFLALSDPSDTVAFEAIRAMFGAPFPRPESIKKRPNAAPVGDASEEAGASKTYGASWHMVIGVSDAPPTVAAELLVAPPPPERKADKRATGDSVDGVGGTAAGSLFACIAARLQRGLKSGGSSLTAAAARTTAVLAESRAWCAALSGGRRIEGESVRKAMAQLSATLSALAGDTGASAVARCAAIEALLWLQEGRLREGREPLVSPALLIKAMSQGGSSVPAIARVLFADPWPDGLVASLQSTVSRWARCHGASAADMALELTCAAAAAAPSRFPREALLAALDAAPGPSGVRAASAVLSSPSPPITQPNANSPVEVKLLAATEEAAYEGLRAAAAWWLAEHANQLAGTAAWKPLQAGAPKTVELLLGHGVAPPASPSERMALAGAAASPLLSMVVSHLQRALLTGVWEVRCAAAQGLAKVAVRSREPHRIQAYAALLATQRSALGPGAGPGSASSPDASDPLGVAAVVRPALEVLDAMYAGEVVVRLTAAQHGRTADGWPRTALTALQRRHDALVFAVQQRVCFVPKDAFFPLGPASKRLLRPDEPADEDEEEEEEEEEAAKAAEGPKGLPKGMLEAATAAAQAAVAAEKAAAEAEKAATAATTYDENSMYTYDQEYYDQQYGGTGYNEDGTPVQEYDPLSNWEGSQNPAFAPRVAIRVDGDGGGDTDDDDYRWAVTVFEFVGEGEDELSVSAAERVKGSSKLQLFNQIAAGLFYTAGFCCDRVDSRPPGEDELSVSAAERVEVLMDMGDWMHVVNANGARGLVPASYIQFDNTDSGSGGGAAGSAAGYAQDEGQEYSGGDASYYAAQAQYEQYDTQQAQQQAYYGAGYDEFDGAEEGGYEEGAGGLDDFGSALSAVRALPAKREAEASAAASQPAATAYSAVLGGVAYVLSHTQAEVSAAASQPAAAASSAGGVVETDDTPAFPSMSTEARAATALYDFTAETEAELTMSIGDQLTLGTEVDGWVQATRDSDGVTGLVPAGYVQLL